MAMYVLLVIGIVLVIFGALVLVKLPDTAGGKVKWLGVGNQLGGCWAAAHRAGRCDDDASRYLDQRRLALAAGAARCTEQQAGPDRVQGPNDSQASGGLKGPDGCFQDYFKGVPLDRVSVVEADADDRPVIRVDQPKDEPFGLQFNNNGVPVGGMRLTFFATDGIFKLHSVVDAQCQSVGTFFNVDRADRPMMVPLNWNTLRLQFDNGAYNLTLDGGEKIKVSFMPAA